MAEELAAGVAEVLRELSEEPGELDLSAIPGGASRETWLAQSGERCWIVRRDPTGSESLVPMREEYGLIQRADDAGVRVPRPLAFEPEGGRFSSAGMLLAHVPGTSVGPRILRKPEYERARRDLPAQLAEALARIHRVRLEVLEDLLPGPPRDPALAQITDWERQLDAIGEPLPAVELGLRWLRANRPQPAESALVHGDFRLGNFIVDEDGLAAVIDWELAHLGDPAEDIGWLCIRSWRFGNDDRPVAGVGELEEFIQAYQLAGGRPMELDRVRYWETFGNVKWAIICARQAQDHLTGVRRSHELASLGRRVSEPEWDLLELMRASPGGEAEEEAF
jgi:aminoglycoside phosphotransferase (APT) family kinase protein